MLSSRTVSLSRSFRPVVKVSVRTMIKGNNPNAKNILGIYNVSPELSALLGKKQVTRQDALKVRLQYITYGPLLLHHIMDSVVLERV